MARHLFVRNVAGTRELAADVHERGARDAEILAVGLLVAILHVLVERARFPATLSTLDHAALPL